ncbi:MAG: hypothetical protein FJ033_10925 [Chloroflexi bacterium]|nr:hypothetical protein [Chloroflexota bacterium]
MGTIVRYTGLEPCGLIDVDAQGRVREIWVEAGQEADLSDPAYAASLLDRDDFTRGDGSSLAPTPVATTDEIVAAHDAAIAGGTSPAPAEEPPAEEPRKRKTSTTEETTES